MICHICPCENTDQYFMRDVDNSSLAQFDSVFLSKTPEKILHRTLFYFT